MQTILQSFLLCYHFFGAPEHAANVNGGVGEIAPATPLDVAHSPLIVDEINGKMDDPIEDEESESNSVIENPPAVQSPAHDGDNELAVDPIAEWTAPQALPPPKPPASMNGFFVAQP